VVASDEVLVLQSRWGLFRVEQFLHRGLIPLGDVVFEFLSGRTETSTTQEMGHESNVLLRHSATSLLRL
jgi:hypothetical protein